MKNMPPRHKLAGQKFGLLSVVRWVRLPDWRSGKWECVCDCGNTHYATSKHLIGGEVKSCGCATFSWMGAAGRTHGKSKTAIYAVWRGMWERCTKPDARSYKNYGGRGIKVCERWESFDNFLSDMGERPPLHTIERIDNDGDYEPGNCRWATRKEQNRNKRQNRLIEHDGVVMCLVEWAERFGLRSDALRRRMDVQGMSFAEAISAPMRYSVRPQPERRQSQR